MTMLRPAGSAYGDLADYPARDNPEPMEPQTEAEYLERKKDSEHAKGFQTALLIMEHHLRNMSEAMRDEMEGHTGIWLESLKETALPGASEARKMLENGIKAWERKP